MKWLTREQKESVALTIFLDVSRSFEEHQGSTDYLHGSSYHEEDLFSNVIGFYRAVRGLDKEYVRDKLQPVGEEKSLEIYKQYGIGKNDNIGKVVQHAEQWENDSQNIYLKKYPSPFNIIRTIRKGKFYEGEGILLRDYKTPLSTKHLTAAGYNHTWLEKFEVNEGYDRVVGDGNVKEWFNEIDPVEYADAKYLVERKKGKLYLIIYK